MGPPKPSVKVVKTFKVMTFEDLRRELACRNLQPSWFIFIVRQHSYKAAVPQFSLSNKQLRFLITYLAPN